MTKLYQTACWIGFVETVEITPDQSFGEPQPMRRRRLLVTDAFGRPVKVERLHRQLPLYRH